MVSIGIQRRCPGLRLLFEFAIAVAVLIVPAFAQNTTNEFSQSTVDCPSNIDIRGYTAIKAMNTDMADELDKIRDGQKSREPYIFVLCPETTFDMSKGSLKPILSGSVFTCGTMGDPTLQCNFGGGSNQVVVDDPVNATNYKLRMISFVGVTFSGFDRSAISGNASNVTTVDLTKSNFEVSCSINWSVILMYRMLKITSMLVMKYRALIPCLPFYNEKAVNNLLKCKYQIARSPVPQVGLCSRTLAVS